MTAPLPPPTVTNCAPVQWISLVWPARMVVEVAPSISCDSEVLTVMVPLPVLATATFQPSPRVTALVSVSVQVLVQLSTCPQSAATAV